MRPFFDFKNFRPFSDPLSENASQWSDPSGPFAVLHDLTVFRMEWILKMLSFYLKVENPKDLKILDVGCGGGLIASPLSRLGAIVTGLDPCQEALDVALKNNDQVSYVCTSFEDFLPEETFDVVIAFEVIEHVPCFLEFLKKCKLCLKKGGVLIGSTLNRTLSSFVLGIGVAEYLLKLVPQGTHDIRFFITVEEMLSAFEYLDLKTPFFEGLSFSVLKQEWSFAQDLSLNYFFSAQSSL